MTNNSKFRRILFTLAAFAFAALLLALLVRRVGDTRGLVGTIKSAFDKPWLLAAGVGLFSVSLSCGLMRWYVLLRALKLPVKFRDAVRLYATGHFFNVLGPGATGGDLVKAAWIASKIPAGQRTSAVASIAAERLIGLMAMVTFIMGVTIFRRDFFDSHWLLEALRKFITLLFAGTILFFILLTSVNWEKIAEGIRLREGGLPARLLGVMVTAWRTLRLCLTHPKAASAAFALSLANHTTDVCVYFLLSRALSMTFPFRDMFVASPIANMTASIPITPGGAGMRENMLQKLLEFAHVPVAQSTALALLMFATIVFWAGVCGVLILVTQRKKS